MQKLFPKKGQKVPELRFEGFEREWKEVRLGEIAKFLKGRGLSKSSIVSSGKFECVLYGGLYTTYPEVINTVISKTNKKEGTLSQKGDVLVPTSTTTTNIDLANATALLKNGVLLGSDITILRNSYNKFDPIFLAYYLTHGKRKEIAKIAQGTTIIHLYGKDLQKLKINLPSFPEQQKIAQLLSNLDNMIQLKQRQIDKMEELKRGLTKRMFI